MITKPPAPSRPALGERALFPTLEARVYLAHAAISPLPAPSRAAVDDVLADYGRRGFFAWQRGHAEQRGLKGELAALLGASAADFALTRGTSASITAVAQSFPFEAGDGLVLFHGEFPTNVTPWLMAARGAGLLVHWLDADAFRPGGAGLGQLERLLRERRGHVRLVAMSAVQFQTGLRMPLAEVATLCRAHGAALAVDAIQAAGVVPLDLAAIDADFVAGGAHKWLMGLEGVGWLWASPRWRGRLRPALAGWLSHEDPARFLSEAGALRYDHPLRPDIDFLEAGSGSVVGAAALRASVALLRELGVDAIFAHVSAWLDRAEAGLTALGLRSLRPRDERGRSGILALTPPDDVALPALRDALIARGVAVTAPDGALRIAPHWPNALSEADLTVELVADSLRELRG